jgi:3'-phosphoadenosine 5'-phosphosulfate (PAPS) 3'-phosphatase
MIDAAIIVLAERLADAAGAAIRPYFRHKLEIETKGDLSPVTAADRASEAAMRAILEAERPHDGIIGEEYGRVREDARYVWVLDPIDGTRAFIAGRPLFGTLIALLDEGRPSSASSTSRSSATAGSARKRARRCSTGSRRVPSPAPAWPKRASAPPRRRRSPSTPSPPSSACASTPATRSTAGTATTTASSRAGTSTS